MVVRRRHLREERTAGEGELFRRRSLRHLRKDHEAGVIRSSRHSRMLQHFCIIWKCLRRSPFLPWVWSGEWVIGRIILYLGRADSIALGVIDRNVWAVSREEVNGGNLAELADGFPDCGSQNLEDALLVLELDFRLRGMDIHVDVGRADIEIDEIGWLHALRHQPVVGIHHGAVEIGMPHETPVDEEIVIASFLARRLRLRHEASYAAESGIHLYGQQVLAHLLAEDVDNTLVKGARPQVEHLLLVAVEYEAYFRVDQYDALEGREDIIQLGGICLEELPAGGNIVKEVVDTEIAAYRTGHRLLTDHPRGMERQTGAYLVAGHARGEHHLRHGSDGGQRLAAEPHGVKGEEIVGLADFRCGMPFESQAGIGFRHAAAVVNDLQGGAACVDHQHTDILGTGIHGILHQLLNDRSGTLNHLASGNLVSNGIGEKLNDVHLR